MRIPSGAAGFLNFSNRVCHVARRGCKISRQTDCGIANAEERIPNGKKASQDLMSRLDFPFHKST
jgi:hypothetical protein